MTLFNVGDVVSMNDFECTVVGQGSRSWLYNVERVQQPSGRVLTHYNVPEGMLKPIFSFGVSELMSISPDFDNRMLQMMFGEEIATSLNVGNTVPINPCKHYNSTTFIAEENGQGVLKLRCNDCGLVQDASDYG